MNRLFGSAPTAYAAALPVGEQPGCADPMGAQPSSATIDEQRGGADDDPDGDKPGGSAGAQTRPLSRSVGR